MSKSTVTWLFVGAIVAVVVGAVVAIATVVVSLANGIVALGGPEVVTVDGGAIPGTMAWLLIASLIITGGTIAAVVSWVGALFNTARLEDKTWFVVLLVLGVFSLGWLAMVAYLMAGPDGTARGAARPDVATATHV
jgi:hypothetical protein